MCHTGEPLTEESEDVSRGRTFDRLLVMCGCSSFEPVNGSDC